MIETQAPSKDFRFLRRTRLLVALCVLTCVGCSYFSPEARKNQKKTVSSKDELILRVSLDKAVYQPNEAVIMEVTVTNTTNETIRITALDSSSASFWFGLSSEDRRLQRHPVVSMVEEQALKRRGSEMIQLKPGKKHSRKFVHTRLTRDPGAFTAQVHMEPFVDITDHRTGKLYSNFVQFRVEGAPVFARDNMGLMMAEDALALVRTKVKETQGEVIAEDHILAKDEAAGFYAWWINMDYRLADGSAYRTSYIVDPYLGRIKEKAKPFPESMKAKPAESGIVPRPAPPVSETP